MDHGKGPGGWRKTPNASTTTCRRRTVSEPSPMERPVKNHGRRTIVNVSFCDYPAREGGHPGQTTARSLGSPGRLGGSVPVPPPRGGVPFGGHNARLRSSLRPGNVTQGFVVILLASSLETRAVGQLVEYLVFFRKIAVPDVEHVFVGKYDSTQKSQRMRRRSPAHTCIATSAE